MREFYSQYKYNYRVIIFSGGYYDYYAGNDNYLNTILQYNSDGDEFTEVASMLEERGSHAISVVKYSDYSQYCQ